MHMGVVKKRQWAWLTLKPSKAPSTEERRLDVGYGMNASTHVYLRLKTVRAYTAFTIQPYAAYTRRSSTAAVPTVPLAAAAVASARFVSRFHVVGTASIDGQIGPSGVTPDGIFFHDEALGPPRKNPSAIHAVASNLLLRSQRR